MEYRNCDPPWILMDGWGDESAAADAVASVQKLYLLAS